MILDLLILYFLIAYRREILSIRVVMVEVKPEFDVEETLKPYAGLVNEKSKRRPRLICQ